MFNSLNKILSKSAIKKSIFIYTIIFIVIGWCNIYLALLALIFVLIQHISDLEHNKYLTDEMPFPYLILEDSKIIYADEKALEIKKFSVGKKITDYIHGFDTNLEKQKIIFDDNYYYGYFGATKIDRTYKILYLIKYEGSETKFINTAVGLIMVDNYDEALKTTEEIKKPLLLALIERKLNAMALDLGGIIKKFEHDKYIFIFSQDKLDYFKEKKFYILDQIREIDMGNQFPLTLSIGIGIGGKTLNQSMEYARASLDLALDRGGDQVLIKNANKFYFFGDKQTKINTNTKVRARVKTYIFKELIAEASNVIVMGHKNSDPDCLGSAIGVYKFVTSEGKKCRIILNEVTESIKLMYEKIIEAPEYKTDVFIKNQEVEKFLDASSLIVIVDTHRPSLLDFPELIENSHHVVVFDHHRKNVEFVDDTVMNYYEPYASSTAELVTEMLQIKDIKLSATEANALLAGIMIDTKNFTFKTGARTYEVAAFLRRKGADSTCVKMFFRDDFETYKTKIATIINMQIFNKNIAISVCEKNNSNAILIAAQAADELLNINGIAAAFVLCEYENKIIISARSLGEINVQLIMERMGGGGHFSSSGAQLEKISLNDAIEKLKNAINS